MRFEGVEFPDSILEAQEKGELVVFAGAGVSMPSPSSLPSFYDLAIELANGASSPRQDEPIDRFLGRLPENLNIYERTKSRLSSPDSRPNSLHRDLLRSFCHAPAVRLVTTNFDNHLTAAFSDVFSDQIPEVFFAPALPVGSDFQGIVHLHGNVCKPARRMVLTDADFGRAYLTEGWARRFLLQLFSNFSVLFIGYSHTDPVMHYVARSLPPNVIKRKRYALSTADLATFWSHLGIQLISYLPENGHAQLQLACNSWARRSQSTPLERRERIKEALQKPPQPTGEGIDLIERAVGGDVVLLRFVSEFEALPQWVTLICNRTEFRRLFAHQGTVNEAHQELARWFAQKVVVQHPSVALDVVRRNGNTLPLVLWTHVSWAIWIAVQRSAMGEYLSQWVPILLANDPDPNQNFLEYILLECKLPEESVSALLLFRHLTRPVFKVRNFPANLAPDDDFWGLLGVDLRTRGEHTHLERAWKRFIDTDFERYAGDFVVMITSHLAEAALLHRAHNPEVTWYDPISVHLPTLNQRDAVLRASGLSVLVDVASETLGWLERNRPEGALAAIQVWAASESVTLKRVALAGVAATAHWTSNDKVAWLLRHNFIYFRGLATEILEVLESAFAQSSPEHRALVVERVLSGPTWASDRVDRDGTTYRYLLRLHDFAGEDPQLDRELQALEARHPHLRRKDTTQESPPSSQPPWERLPFSAESLSAQQPEACLAELNAAMVDPEGNSPAVLMVVEQAVQDHVDWGIQLALALCEWGTSKTDLWRPILTGWRRANLNPTQWETILAFLSGNEAVLSHVSGEATELLSGLLSREDTGIEPHLLPMAIDLVPKVWAALQSRPASRSEATEWLTVAINDPAGNLALFAVRSLSKERKVAGDAWVGVSSNWRGLLEMLISGDTWSVSMARVVIASQLAFFLAIDAQWAIAWILPLFDWGADPLRAQQAWHGYLVWGRSSDELLQNFLPYFVQTFAHVTELGKFRDKFCEELAAIAIFSEIDPLTNRWLTEFLRTVDEDSRVGWAASVAGALQEAPEGRRARCWNTWMKTYWRQRLEGRPFRLSREESGAMVAWLLHIGEGFQEGVRFLIEGPLPSPRHDYSHVLMDLQDFALDNTNAEAAAEFMLCLLRSSERMSFFDPADSLVRRLARMGAERVTFLAICEKLAELGYSGAAELKAFVEADKPA